MDAEGNGGGGEEKRWIVCRDDMKTIGVSKGDMWGIEPIRVEV